MRTRIKMCGITREADARSAVAAGADALGLVFYAPSPRAVDIERARVLCQAVPAFVSTVGLFVNAEPREVREVLEAVPLSLLQFHGDEDRDYCASFGRPWMKAARMRAGFDLLNYAARFAGASALLVDAWVEGYGGGGECFDWSLLAERPAVPLVLAGGLHPGNVAEAVRVVRPWAVDVSSGIERARGEKDSALMEAFAAGVREADGR